MRHLTLLALLLLLPALSAPAQQPPPELDVRFHEVLRLGEERPGEAEAYLFGQPMAVATDSRGRIYVADRMSHEIGVFSPEGELLHTMGGRGRGPGEFEYFQTLTVNGQDELIVIDDNQRRITRFGPGGEVLETHRPRHASLIRPARLWPYEADGSPAYMTLTKILSEQVPGTGHEHLFHIFDSSFDEKNQSFASHTVVDQSDDFVKLYMHRHPGSALPLDGGAVLFAPSLYRGELFRYATSDEEPRATLQGYVEDDETPFIRLDPERDDYNTYIKIHRIEDGEAVVRAGRPLRVSAGLFQLSTGEIVHFTYYNHDTHAHLGAEVFAEDGELIGYGRVEENLRAQLHDVSLRAMWIDEEDRLYLIDETEEPVIRVVEFEYEVVD